MSSSPRLFISYSWTTADHEKWVLDLATELVNSGVDVILDKWQLREGHDAIAFMEKMVTDATIKKVILICDKAYADKTDGRAGGVGTEAQIISAKIYGEQAQDKFVAVIAERDETGKPYLPTYYKSRIFIDLSEPDQFSKNLEVLLRWIYDKPLNVRPPVGQPPSFIVNPDTPAIGTVMIGKRVIEGFKNNSAYTKGALDEYLTTFGTNIERFRIVSKDGNFDDHVVQSIEDFTPSRNDFVQVMMATIQYSDPLDHIERIHRFFELLIQYLFRPTDVLQWSETDFDNFRFIIHELFLYTVTLLIRAEKFDAATYLLEQVYYREDSESRGEHPTTNFTIFRTYMRSLEIRNRRLERRRLSIRADLLEERSKTSGIPFRSIMQTDFICFMRAELLITEEDHRWFPETLLYTNRVYGPFEIFARSISKKYLAKVLVLLGVPDLATIRAKLDGYQSGTVRLPQWEFQSVHPRALMGFEKLGTLP